MLIFLADLFNVYQAGRNTRTNPYTVPLAIGFLASTLKVRVPGCTVRLFRDPDRLVAALKETPPDLLGFSICSWNMDLSRRLSDRAKALCPQTLQVGGGPCVDDADDQLVDTFAAFPALDFLVPNEGESGIVALLEAIKAGEHRDRAIAGVAYLGQAGKLVRGSYERPAVTDKAGRERLSPKQVREKSTTAVDIPSPYLDGTLDEFLDEGLVPIVQTMRGCPYQCHFCVSGASEWNAMRGFDLERVYAEIDYALDRSGSTDLILTDENWGILGERDVELARFISQRRLTRGAPQRLYYYTAKIVTDASRAIVEMVAPMAWIGEFSMSFQSLNPETRAAIKRTNISFDKLSQNVKWARERKIPTSSEMIYGFPYETSATFFDGIETLMRVGIDIVEIFPLQLFPGIDLTSRQKREDYALSTRFRMADCGYGIYENGKLLSVETEEIIFSTRWSTEADYFAVRRYGFFQQIVQTRGYLAELTRLCLAMGTPVEPVMRHLALLDYAPYPALAALLADHHRESLAELKDSREEVLRDVAERLERGEDVLGNRINLVYMGKLFSSPQATAELLDIIQRYIRSVVAEPTHRRICDAYLTEILPNRIVRFEVDPAESVEFASSFDYAAWASEDFADVSELLLDRPRTFTGTIAEEMTRKMATFDPANRSRLQGVFEGMASRHYLRTVTEHAAGIHRPRSDIDAGVMA